MLSVIPCAEKACKGGRGGEGGQNGLQVRFGLQFANPNNNKNTNNNNNNNKNNNNNHHNNNTNNNTKNNCYYKSLRPAEPGNIDLITSLQSSPARPWPDWDFGFRGLGVGMKLKNHITFVLLINIIVVIIIIVIIYYVLFIM